VAVTDIATRVRRARKDKVAAAIAAAVDLGIKFTWHGADLVISGTSRLNDRDRAILQLNVLQIVERLGIGSDDAAILEELGVEAELVTDPELARQVIAELPESCGIDCETEPLPEHALPRPPLVITKKGALAAHQPEHKDPAGLDPHRGRVRLLQLYSPEAEKVWLIDLRWVPLEALDGLWARKLIAHNATFECAMLGGRPARLIDSMQVAGLVLGTAAGVRKLSNVAEAVLGVTLQKDSYQTSDWSAPRLSFGQLGYAGSDAVIAYRAARALYSRLGKRERRAFAIQNAVVPVVAGLRVRGCPFDRLIHARTIKDWELEHAKERERFCELTGEEPPGQGKVGDWIEGRLPPEDIAWMPRTATGKLSARADLLKHLADREEIRPLLRVLWSDKRLRTFGHSLLGLISPVTGRLHVDFMVCGAKSGRITASRLQQLPPDVRKAVVAPAGKVLIAADYAQIELRVLAELADDAALRRVFATGGDVHREAAARITRIPIEQVTPEQRRAAKPIVFGTVYGSGARGLRASAWANFDIELSIGEAAAAKEALLSAYSGVRDYQRDQAERAQQEGVLWSVAGRPLRARWEKGGQIRYTVAVNYAV
jgi:DNA polymerase-1